MGDLIFLVQHRVERLQDRRATAGRQIVDHHVAGEGVHIAANAPDVQVVHILNAPHQLYIVDQVRYGHALRRRFEQDIQRLAQQTPRTKRHDYSDTDREDRVSRRPARQQDDDACKDDADRGADIAQDVEGGRTYVQVVLILLQAKGDKQVDGYSDGCRAEHDKRLNRLRMLETLYRLPGDGDRDQYQQQRVEQCRQDANAVIPEGLPFIGRSLRLHGCEPRQAQRKHVGDDMSGIGEQRQGVCQQTANHARTENDQRQEEGEPQRLFCHAMCVVMPGMSMADMLVFLYTCCIHDSTPPPCSTELTEARANSLIVSRAWATPIVNNWRICSSISR